MNNGDLELGDVNIIQETTQSLLDHVTNIHNQANQSSPSIFMASGKLRDLSPNSFDPRVVSIGPLHRQDAKVQAFEKHKASFMIKLMSRIVDSSRDEILKSCMQKVYSSMDRIKECYVWTTPCNDAAIAKMMVLDACFILEFIHCQNSESEDLFHGNKSLAGNVCFDLMLLENQIPFFCLYEIFKCTILKFKPTAVLNRLLLKVLSRNRLFEKQDYSNSLSISIDTTKHILSLLHQFYKPPDTIKPQFLTETIHSVVDLDRAQVNFLPNQNPIWLMEMKVELAWVTCFCGPWCKTTLRMPILDVFDTTESILRNLIAYEDSFPTGNHISSYAYTMDKLVNTHEDVAKLVKSGVLLNNMGSNEEVANLFNKICKFVECSEVFYQQEWQTLNTYCNGCWPKNIAWLRSTHLRNPWTVTALLAGIAIFALTVVQTIYNIKSASRK